MAIYQHLLAIEVVEWGSMASTWNGWARIVGGPPFRSRDSSQGAISECCGLNRNHPQRLGSGSSLSHEKEWNDLVPANHACVDFRTLRRLFLVSGQYRVNDRENPRGEKS